GVMNLAITRMLLRERSYARVAENSGQHFAHASTVASQLVSESGNDVGHRLLSLPHSGFSVAHSRFWRLRYSLQSDAPRRHSSRIQDLLIAATGSRVRR